MRTVLVAIADLIFLSKVDATARGLGAHVERARRGETLWREVERTGATRVLVDLAATPGTPDDVAVLRAQAPELEVIGYCRHTQEALIARGEAAGCTRVLTQGEFSAQLPQLLG